jgi:hypothetical protein
VGDLLASRTLVAEPFMGAGAEHELPAVSVLRGEFWQLISVHLQLHV